MTIRTKVLSCSIAILFLFSGVSLYSYSRSKQTNQRLVWVNDLFLPLSRQIVQLQGQVQGLVDDMRRNLFLKERNSESSTISRVARDLYPYVIQKRFSSIESLLEKQKQGDPVFIRELSHMLTTAKGSFAKLASETSQDEFETVYTELRASLQAMSKRVDDESQKITRSAQEDGTETLFSSAFLSILVLFFGVATVMVASKVLRPLPLLIQGVKNIRDGNFHQSLKMSSSEKDEIAFLAREFNLMLEALRERDVKIQKQQRELVQSERLAAIGQLSAEVVHEIRNPLNSISLNIDWLASELVSSDPEITKTLDSLAREISRLNQITESYLSRSRVPSQEQQATPVNELLREIVGFERDGESGKVQIETALSEKEIYVKSDRSRLKQAFLNVMKNAKEAMPRGGKIVVETLIKDNVSSVRFRDNGTGMSEKVRKQTFLPFFTTKQNGTGIGLTLTKEIIEEANGKIDCESEIGSGTTFTFSFPV